MDDEKFGDNGITKWRIESAADHLGDGPDDDSEPDPERARLDAMSDEELNAEIEMYDRKVKEIDAQIESVELKKFLTPEEVAGVNHADMDAVKAMYDLARSRRDEQRATRDRQIELEVFQKQLQSEDSEDSGIEALEEAPRCEHMRTNNQQCGSPAMGGKRYCYFHSQTRDGRKRKKKPMQMPVLEDQRSIQLAVTRVCQAIADETLDAKRASALLYGLQVAGNAVKQVKPVVERKRRK